MVHEFDVLVCSIYLYLLQPNQVSTDEPMVASQYIDNPLCVNGKTLLLHVHVHVHVSCYGLYIHVSNSCL